MNSTEAKVTPVRWGVQSVLIAIASLAFSFLVISWFVMFFFNSSNNEHNLERQASPILMSLTTLILQVVMLSIAIYFGPIKTGSAFKSLGFSTINWSFTLRWAFIALFLSLVTSIVYAAIAESIAPQFLPPNLKEELGLEKNESTLLIIMIFVVLALGAPFSEEVFNRGFIMQGLNTSFGKWPAIILSSAFFGAAHMSLGLLVPAFISGIIFGVVFSHTRSIWPVFIAHMCQNTLAFTALMLT